MECTVRNASLSEALARVSLVQAPSPWTDQQKTHRDSKACGEQSLVLLSWQGAGFPMALVCSCERGPGVSGSKAVQVLAQVTQRPHILLWQLLCLLFAAGGHQQQPPTRILLVAAPSRLLLLGSQRQQQLSTHLPLAASASAPRCWSFPAAALSHSGPVWLQLFCANGSIEPWF